MGEVALKLVAGREAHGVHYTVQAVPLRPELFEYIRDIRITGHVAQETQRGVGAPFAGKLSHARLELFILVSESQFGPFAMHRGGDARGNGQFAGHANDQNPLAGEESHVFILELQQSFFARLRSLGG